MNELEKMIPKELNNIIENTMVGKLIDYSQPEKETRKYSVIIRFKYFKELMMKLDDGDFVIIENFHSDSKIKTYSLLQVSDIFPIHFAIASLGKNLTKPHPGYVWAAWESGKEDFFSQTEKSEIDETFIDCKATPVGFDFIINKNNTITYKKSRSKPIPGGNVFVLKPESIQKVYNKHLEKKDSAFTVGNIKTLRSKKDLEIKMDSEKLIKTHFGVFATTGAGKSNLISTTIRNLLATRKDLKIIIFDLSTEYPALLIDEIIKNNSILLFLEPSDFPIRKEQLIFRVKVPEDLEKYRNEYKDALTKLYGKRRIRLIRPEPNINRIISEFRFSTQSWSAPSGVGLRESIIRRIKLESVKSKDFNKLREIANEESSKLLKKYKGKADIDRVTGMKKKFEDILDNIETTTQQYKDRFTNDQLLTDKDVLQTVLSNNDERLFIVCSTDVEEMRRFITNFTYQGLAYRKNKATDKPLVLMIFDEAHEFIPRTEGESTVSTFKSIEQIARQGRKYGLGVCISSQRCRNLNTNIIAMLHSYFAGQLPFPTDRSHISDAFNVNKDILLSTIDFDAGDWLISSLNSLGIKSVPIIIRSKNAESDADYFLKNKEYEKIDIRNLNIEGDRLGEKSNGDNEKTAKSSDTESWSTEQ